MTFGQISNTEIKTMRLARPARAARRAPARNPGNLCVECVSRDCHHMQRASRELTPRMLDVLRHLAAGATNKDIADALGLTEGTVKVYLHSMFPRLGVHSRLQAALWAREHEAQLRI